MFVSILNTKLMKRILALLIFTVFINQAQAFKVVGYLPTYRFEMLNNIDFSKITHVCASFANPGSEGEFIFSQNLEPLVEKAHLANCKVFISIGGGGLSTVAEDTYRNKTDEANRPALIHSLMSFVLENNLDGVDVDLEGSMVQMSTYNDFVQDLMDSAKVHNIEVSAALAKWTGSSIERETVEDYDLLNLMSYDNTGPWTLSNPGQHSPMSQTTGDFNYWSGRGAYKKNIIIGLPFYGYEFQVAEVPAWTWCEIVSAYPDSLYQDEIMTDEGLLYFNGISTIEDKVQYAIDNGAGGVMIWELGQDCFGENSLLNVIDAKLKSNKIHLNQDELAFNLSVYPNPVTKHVHIAGILEGVFRFYNPAGSVVKTGDIKQGSIDMSSVKKGFYILQIQNEKTSFTHRLVKM